MTEIKFTKVYRHYDFTDDRTVEDCESPNTTLSSLDEFPSHISLGEEGLRPLASPSPVIIPSDSLQVCIYVGQQVFFESLAILQCASPVLVKHMKVKDDGSYSINLSHRSTHEYELLRPFLQPHAKQAAVLTPHNLTWLLKWIYELRLEVLLQQCDAILSTCVTDITVSEQVYELLKLSQIATHCGLSRTLQSCWSLWNHVLQRQPKMLELSALQSLCRWLTQSAVSRDTLWPSIVQYLPSELPVYDKPHMLVQNPLLPYLLREGLHKEEAPHPSSVSPSLNILPVFEDTINFQDWWNVPDDATLATEEIGDLPACHIHPSYCDPTIETAALAHSIKHCWKAKALPSNRLEWLETILKNLQSESIFQTNSSEDDNDDEDLPRIPRVTPRSEASQCSVNSRLVAGTKKSLSTTKKMEERRRVVTPRSRDKSSPSGGSFDESMSKGVVMLEGRKFLC